MLSGEENDGRRATRTRSRPARRMTADEQRVRDISQRGMRPDVRSRLNIYFWFDPRHGLMLKLFILIKILVNAITLRREFSILFKRVAICILLYSGIMGYDSLYIT